MTAIPAGMSSCLKCGSVWGGLNTCHCTGCHNTFSGITAFDKHRIAATEGPKRPFGACHGPATMTRLNSEGEVVPVFEMADRKYPCWTLAGSKKEPEDG